MEAVNEELLSYSSVSTDAGCLVHSELGYFKDLMSRVQY